MIQDFQLGLDPTHSAHPGGSHWRSACCGRVAEAEVLKEAQLGPWGIFTLVRMSLCGLCGLRSNGHNGLAQALMVPEVCCPKRESKNGKISLDEGQDLPGIISNILC